MFEFRDYQKEAVLSIPRYFAEKKGNPLIAMPTGTGKSVVIAGILQYMSQYPGQRAIVATHVKELIEQNHSKLLAIWPQAPAGIYSAGLKKRERHFPITFAGIGSVAKRASEFGKTDLLIIDEAHLVSPNEETNYQRFIADLKKINPCLKVIGLTATPWRLGHGHITENGGIFSDVCFDITGLQAFNRLIAEGYLSTLIPKNTQTLLDVSGVHLQGGEFKAGELQLAVDKSDITEAALKEALALGQDRNHWLVFCAGVEHAHNTADMLNAMGIRSVVVHNKMTDAERDQAIAGWKSGYYRAAVNNNILTTGIDFPGIDFIIVLRPTNSTVLWVQMLGRGTRPVFAPGFDLDTPEGRLAAIAAGPKQNCLCLDFAQNSKRLGPINDPRIPNKKGTNGGPAPVKLCEKCGVWNHPSVRHCFYCGAEFLFTVKIKETAATQQLIKSDDPVTEVFKVEQITYFKHEKTGRPPSLRLSYYCNLRKFNEFVPLELEGSARGIAKRWWHKRLDALRIPYERLPLPNTVDDAMRVVDQLPAATHIRVWVNKTYPEIIAHCFDGTAFGKEEACTPPTVVKDATAYFQGRDLSGPKPKKKTEWTDMDDDIPF